MDLNGRKNAPLCRDNLLTPSLVNGDKMRLPDHLDTNDASCSIVPIHGVALKNETGKYNEPESEELQTLSISAPYRPKRLTSIEKEISSFLVPDSKYMFFAESGTKYLLEVMSSAINTQHDYTLNFNVDGIDLTIGITTRLLEEILKPIYNGLLLDDVPLPLLLAIIQRQLEHELSILSKNSSVSFSIDSLCKGNTLPKKSHSIRLSVASTESLGCLTLFVDEDSIPAIKKIAINFEVESVPTVAIDQIPMPISLGIDAIQLSKNDLSTLALDDIILSNKNTNDQTTEYCLNIGKTTMFMASLEDNSVQITRPYEGVQMNHSSLEEIENAAQTSLNDLPINVLFEVAQQQISMGEFAKLSPGQVVNLKQPIDPVITVRANGLAVAKAELVEIDNRIGARITELLVKDSHCHE